MASRSYSFRSPPALAISVGATMPNPGIVGVVVWSTIEQQRLCWTGSAWQFSSPALSSFVPAPVAAVSVLGGGSRASRADHVHVHGVQDDSALHAVASPAGAGFMTAAQKLKLNSLGAGVAASAGAVDAGKVPLLGVDGRVAASCLPPSSGIGLASVAGRSVIEIAQQGSAYGAFAAELLAPREWTVRTRRWQAQWGTVTPLLDGFDSVTSGTVAACAQPSGFPSSIEAQLCRVKISGASASVSCGGFGFCQKRGTSTAKFFQQMFSAFRVGFPAVARDRFFVGFSQAAGFGSTAFLNTTYPTSGLFGFVWGRGETQVRFLAGAVVTLSEPLVFTGTGANMSDVVYDFVISRGRTTGLLPPANMGIAWRKWPDGAWKSQSVPIPDTSWLYDDYLHYPIVWAGSSTIDVAHMIVESD